MHVRELLEVGKRKDESEEHSTHTEIGTELTATNLLGKLITPHLLKQRIISSRLSNALFHPPQKKQDPKESQKGKKCF